MLKREKNEQLKKILKAIEPENTYEFIRGLAMWDTRTTKEGSFEAAFYIEAMLSKLVTDDDPIGAFKRLIIDEGMRLETKELILDSYSAAMLEYTDNDVVSSLIKMDNEEMETVGWDIFKDLNKKVTFLGDHVKLQRLYEEKR